jgi:ribosomal peptide maturation radical SAM protein 1
MGLAYRKDGKAAGQGTARIMELDELPYPDFTDYFRAVEKWAPDLMGKVPLSIELSRGCWWSSKSQCTFCGIHSELNAYRQKSPDRALDEIEELVSRYGVDHVWVIDSNLPPGYFHSVLPALSKREKKLSSFFVETKATLKRESLQALKQAGATAFQPGIESLDTEILRYMSKGTTMLQNVRILKWAREYGLLPVWNFLHSFPGENEEAYGRMAAIVPWLVHLQPPLNVGPVALQRFSPMYRDPEQWKIINIRAGKSYEFIYPFPLEEQNRLAYTFEYDVAAAEEGSQGFTEKDGMLRDGLHASVKEILLWKDYWRGKEPPLLAYEWTPGGGMTVYDTRPARRSSCTELGSPLAHALYGCDSELNFREICQYVKNNMDESDYPGDSFMQAGLGMLENSGFLLRDEGRYISLALPLEAHRKNNDSFLAYLLGN